MSQGAKINHDEWNIQATRLSRAAVVERDWEEDDSQRYTDYTRDSRQRTRAFVSNDADIYMVSANFLQNQLESACASCEEGIETARAIGRQPIVIHGLSSLGDALGGLGEGRLRIIDRRRWEAFTTTIEEWLG